MALEVLTVEYGHKDESDGFTESNTVYATRITGDWYQVGGEERRTYEPHAWRVSEYGLPVYPEEVDAYIELLQKIKATAKK